MNRKKTVRRLKKALASSRKKAGRSLASALKVGSRYGARGLKIGSEYGAKGLKVGSEYGARGLKAGAVYGSKGMKVGAKGLKAGGKKLKEAELRGDLDKWKTRVGLGLQALEVAAIATAAYKGATVKVGKPRAAAKRARRAPAKRKASR